MTCNDMMLNISATERYAAIAQFQLLDRIELRGLIKRPELNKRRGALVKCLDHRGRWQVRIDGIEELMTALPANLQKIGATSDSTVTGGRDHDENSAAENDMVEQIAKRRRQAIEETSAPSASQSLASELA